MRLRPGPAVAAPAIVAALLAATPLAAQRDSLPTGGYVMEIQMRDRWLHGRQQPAFTPFRSEQRWMFIDSLPAPAPDGRSLSLRYAAFGGHNATARLQLSGTGQVIHTDVVWPDPNVAPFQTSADSLRIARMMLLIGGYSDGRLSLPEERTWEIVPTFAAGAPRIGARWTDTIRLDDERGGNQQSLSGVRVSAIVRDTTVDGRRMWIVRDSAVVRYREQRIVQERTLGTPATVIREVSGVVRGRHLYDPAQALWRVRGDTARLSGEATLRYGDGRSFRTPAVYERTRRWTLLDAPAYAGRRADIRREQDASYGGMVMIPRNELQRRLREGDAALRDSLVSAWRGSADPNQREDLVQVLRFWGSMGREGWADLLRLRLAAGDTSAVLRELAIQPFSSRGGIDEEGLRIVLPFMMDPGLPFAFGLDRDPFYENLRESLLSRPPVITPDSAGWSCSPEACALLARQWEEASEPRLRNLGLIARLVVDPARWSDTLLARAAEDSSFLWSAAQLVRGVGATWLAASKAPLPPSGADWRAWQEWMNGQDPAYVSPTGSPPPQGPRWGSSHETALRFYAARSGRDVVGELRQAFAAASSDTARLVFGTMLLGLREHRPVAAEVANRILRGSRADFALAVQEMYQLFAQATAPDPPTRAVLTDQMLAAVLSGENPWRPAGPSVRAPDFKPILHSNAERPAFLVTDSLPAEVAARWADRIQLISAVGMRSRSDHLAGVYFVPGRIERAGPFARVQIDYHERRARAPDEAPVGYAGGLTAYLIETPEGWMLVSLQQWVT